MIFSKKQDLNRYLGISAEMDETIRIVSDCDLCALHLGRNDFSDSVSGNRFSYTTGKGEDGPYETHMKYADIHLLLSGTEYVYIADIRNHNKTEMKLDEDYIGSYGDCEVRLRLTEEDVLIVFPGEAHKTKCAVNLPERVEKLVIKVPMSRKEEA